MLFRVYEHYNDDDDFITNGYEECFICYEPYTISLKTQAIYNKLCNCDGWIHKRCLDIWYKTQKKCPICRLVICENLQRSGVLINPNPYSNYSYLFICKSLNAFSKITKMILYCFLFCTII